jgi:hypothetical protein
MTVTLRKTNNRVIAAELITRLDEKYELVYVDYRDKLTDEQVDNIVSDDMEAFWTSTEEWESNARYESAKFEIEQLLKDLIREWENEDDEDYDHLTDQFLQTEEFDEVRYAIEERDESDWVTRLASNTPRALLRITAIDEDHGFAFEDVQAEQVLARVGLSATEHNLRVINDMLPECSPEFSVLLGYWIVGADVADLVKLNGEEPVDIVNPHLYLGNPFSGSGYISEEPLHGVKRIMRDEVHTDKGAFGYSVTEIFGGLDTSQFEAEVKTPAKVSLVRS